MTPVHERPERTRREPTRFVRWLLRSGRKAPISSQTITPPDKCILGDDRNTYRVVEVFWDSSHEASIIVVPA